MFPPRVAVACASRHRSIAAAGGRSHTRSNVVNNSRVNTQPIWWEVRPILVMDRSDWPAPDGSSGITSSKIMDAAEAAGRAVEVGSNFFLFFSSKANPMKGMPGM